MNILTALAVLAAIVLAGCASTNPPARPSATGTGSLHPQGTDVGTPFPGVNQSTGAPTTASASSDSR